MVDHLTAISYLCNGPEQGCLPVLPVKRLPGNQHFEICGVGLPAIHLDGSGLFGATEEQKTAWPLPVAMAQKRQLAEFRKVLLT